MATAPFNSVKGFSTGVTGSQVIDGAGNVTARGLSLSSNITFADGTTQGTKPVTTLNGQVGDAWAYGFFHGFTSTIDVFTFPDGNTANTSNGNANYYQAILGSPSNARPVRTERIYFIPIDIPRITGIQSFGFLVNTSVTGGYILGVYDNTEFGYPKNRVYTSGTQTVPSGNIRVTLSPSGGITLSPGTYWLALVFDGTPSVVAINSDNVKLRGGSRAWSSGYHNSTIASEGNGFTLPSTTNGMSLRWNDFPSSNGCNNPLMEFRVK